MTSPAMNRSASRSAIAAPRTPRGSLITGATILTVLLAANIAAYVIPPERSRVDFLYEPPHVLWLQRMLWPSDVRDTVVHVLGQSDDAASPSGAFSSRPTATARKGKAFEYRAQSTLPLTNYTLQGEVPDGLVVDPATGVVSGVPTTIGKYEVVLAGTLGADRQAEQHFTLYVDDRLLLLGADGMGRDVVNRLGASAKYTVVPGLIAVVIGVAGGALLGALGGFYGGTARRIHQAVTAVIQSVPALLIIFIAGAIFQYNAYVMMVIVGLILLPETANGVFERVESFQKREFVEAARELGMRDRTILWNEIVWHNARSFLLTKVTQGFVYAILVAVTLSYLGLTDRNLPQIGGMLMDGREAMINKTTSVVAVASLGALLMVIAGFSLMERGILRSWERRR